jgi:hypothetical protein
MPLDSDDLIRIYKEAVLGMPLSIDTDEARAFRAKIEPGIKEAGEKGLICDIPSEIPPHSEPSSDQADAQRREEMRQTLRTWHKREPTEQEVNLALVQSEGWF